MNAFAHLSIHLAHLPGTLLYFTQAGTHAWAFWTVRRGKHAPCYVYLAACLAEFALGVLFCSPLE